MRVCKPVCMCFCARARALPTGLCAWALFQWLGSVCWISSNRWTVCVDREHLNFSSSVTGLVAIEGAPPIKSSLLSDLAVLRSKYDNLFSELWSAPLQHPFPEPSCLHLHFFFNTNNLSNVSLPPSPSPKPSSVGLLWRWRGFWGKTHCCFPIAEDA